MEGTSSPSPLSEIFDVPLSAIGFNFEEVSPHRVTSSLLVTEKCVQPFKVLHVGVSALIAEAGGPWVGAHLLTGYKRVAGIQLSINHVKSVLLGKSSGSRSNS
ncbi:1,4-dihydroxy-2-naphthoyl-CoA thioesterase 1-like [Punica granatum]|uniref:1,4-dihydroxy-2-naphthoyl-CoA thioesterase 1-like n=1 Tax=Punica granatum TaxID=22663 RepID=A0A6P8DZW4_PUNGR|nr:1,4-dihydroxy-2-naphthoyl-CoA thioesterase 1-like [Punica granatum]